jgi:hypothetical protein
VSTVGSTDTFANDRTLIAAPRTIALAELAAVLLGADDVVPALGRGLPCGEYGGSSKLKTDTLTFTAVARVGAV